MSPSRVHNSTNYLAVAFAAMDEGVVVQNAKGELMLFNPAALRITGVTEDQFLGKESFDPKWKAVNEDGSTMSPQQHPAMLAQKSGKMVKNHVMGFHRPNGDICWISLTAIPQFENGSTQPTQVVITFHDITDERNSRKALEDKEAEISRLLNSVPAFIGYWDRELHNVFVNQPYAELFGKTVSALKGRHIVDVIGNDLYMRAEPHLKLALQGQPQSFEAAFMDTKAVARHVVVQYLPDFRDGEVIGFYSVATDFSRLKRLENERREFESKFIAASKMSSLGEMAAGIAHEINNPLAIINGKTTLLQERIERGAIDTKKFASDLVVIGETVERIAKTVRGLLSFSRNSEGEEKRSVGVRKVVDGTLDLCREKMRNRGVDLRLNISDEIEIDCRPNQVSQILMNLLNNAFDAINDQPEQWIAIEATVRNGRALIRVIDSGKRIPSDVAMKLMQPFFTTKEIGKGTGLGLSISKGLAENQGGALNYDVSSANTCFVLEVPLAKSKDRKVAVGA